MNYKIISYNSYSNNEILEFDLKENMILGELFFIAKMSIFLELIEHAKPKKVIFINVCEFLTINKKLHEYTRSYIFDRMKYIGVENIYFEIPKEKDNHLDCLDYFKIITITNKSEINN